MRSHAEIIGQHGGYSGFAAKLAAAGFPVPASRVRFWERRESIPAEAWSVVSKAGLAKLEELAEAAANREGRAA